MAMSTIPPVQFTSAAEDQLRPPRSPQDFVHAMDDDKLVCRAQGHAFPRMRPGPLPPGVRSRRQLNGTFQLTWTCPDCGTVRTRTTLPGGGADDSAAYDYKHPDGYRAPRGSGLNRAHFAAELNRRMEPWIRSAAE